MVGFKRDDTLTSNQKLIAGVVSGCVTRFLTQPLDVIKLKTQLQKPSKKKKPARFFNVTRSILKDGGFRAFWRGHNLGQMHTMIAVGSQFYIYEVATSYAKTLMESNYRQPTIFACAFLAGCLATTLVVPLEVIRVRQMMTKNQYKGLFRGAHEVYKTGGLKTFYSGLQASLIQMGPSVGISFTVFTTLQEYILRELAQTEKKECSSNYGKSLNSAYHIAFASSVAGSIAGFTAKTLTYPFDLAKRRLQIKTHEDKEVHPGKKLIKCKTLTSCLVQAYKREGFFGLFKGWKVTIYKAQLTSVIAFTSYELSCYLMRDLLAIKV